MSQASEETSKVSICPDSGFVVLNHRVSFTLELLNLALQSVFKKEGGSMESGFHTTPEEHLRAVWPPARHTP